MSRKYRPHYADSKGAIIEPPVLGILFAEGPTVPVDGSAGYAHGCLFLKRNGTTSADAVYYNSSTNTSCVFTQFSVLGGQAQLTWDTTDANANELNLQLPAGGVVNVPVLVVGQGINGVDLGLFNGLVDPNVALMAAGAVTTGPVLRFYKARGTLAAPTVNTAADDIGQLAFYSCVAAGEYVKSCSIEADCVATQATTRGPGTLTFKTGTDAAPTVLTAALLLDKAQNVTIGGGAATQTLTFNTSGTQVVLSASTAALAMGAITLNVTGTRFVQSYHTNLTSTNAVTVDSSFTVKHDIADYEGDALAVIEGMEVCTFKHDAWLDETQQTKLGIIAESVHEPLAVQQIERDGGYYPGVNLYGLAAIQTKAIQQLAQENRELKAAVAKLLDRHI